MLTEIARAKLPTKHGLFTIVAYRSPNHELEPAVLLHGNVTDKARVLTRIHSECLTGDAFGSLKCDCGQQLDIAMDNISKQECGIIIYLRQEGRGMGFANKIKAYALQDGGMDTVEANCALGFPSDSRDYEEAAQILELLGVKSINLMTNNPKKVAELKKHGIIIEERISHESEPNRFNKKYLKTKKSKMGHMLSMK